MRDYDVGVVLPRAEPRAIAAAVKTLMGDPSRMEALRVNATFAARKLDGRQEMAVLRAFLKGIG